MAHGSTIIVIFCAGSAFAQQIPTTTPDPQALNEKQRKESAALADAWLHSPNARTRAWGAYITLRDRIADRVPDLLSVANSYPVTSVPASLDELADHDAMWAVLDTLIQMKVDVPSDTAAKLYPEFPAQAMILLARSASESGPALLEIFKGATDRYAAWLAAGNLLVGNRTPGFAAAVLSTFVVHAQLLVLSKGQGYGMSCGGAFTDGGSSQQPHAGWPEIGTYSLSACATADNVVLAAGVHPAFYRRSVNNFYAAEPEDLCSNSIDKESVRADYIGTLLGLNASKPPVPSKVTQTMIWTSDDEYLSQLNAFIATQQALFSDVAQRLQAAGLLTESESKIARPRLAISLSDMRETKSSPLPKPAVIDENVTF